VLAAEEILARWIDERDRSPLDRVVQNELRGRRYLNSSERRWTADAVFGCVRLWRRHAYQLDRAALDHAPRQRVELWLQTGMAADPDNRALPGPDSPSPYLRETLSFPDTMADELEALLGASAPEAAKALNSPAPAVMRVNTLRTTRQKTLERLPDSRPTPYSPWGIELAGRVNIHELPAFRDGWFEVQEEASQLVALLTCAQPGQTVLDIGAGSGGKSLALAAMMRNQGILLAMDSAPERLARLQDRARRAGAAVVQPLELTADEEGVWQLSGRKQRSLSRFLGKADCVLVDAPCSGSGVLRRSPDLKWRDQNVPQITRLQLQLIEQSAPFVATGGRLVYATCAFEREQNEAIVEAFLETEAGRGFEVEPALPRLEQAIRAAIEQDDKSQYAPAGQHFESLACATFIRTWPHLHNMDAYFIGSLVHK
jgi:16S rRNA (cytosine967-C5)-methyltransferase